MKGLSFPIFSFHLFFFIDFRSDKRSEPSQAPSLKPIPSSSFKPKGMFSQLQNPIVKKGMMAQNKDALPSASRQTEDYGFAFILRCI
jgi:hypothetical protein